jgi:sulfatase maturation enzyme AslB (radical SAM superfamily)
MKLRSTRSKDFFYVDWWLLNHCNYNCSYCADLLKNGSIDLPDIDHCKRIVDEISLHARSNRKICDFKIVGGEVTTWPLLIELLEYINFKGNQVSIRTNASSSISKWSDIVKYIDGANLEFHPEYASPSHFFLMIEIAKKKSINLNIIVNMMADRWESTMMLIKQIEEKWPDQLVNKKMLFDDPARNTSINKNYQKEQIIQFKKKIGPLIVSEDNEEISTDFNTLILEGKNRFLNRSCNIGIEQIIIDAWGRVAKGHCRNGGHIGSITKGIKFPTEPTICQKESCNNGFDIHATKF